MPSNEVKINNAISYSVGDSKMPELMKWLDENGHKQEDKREQE